MKTDKEILSMHMDAEDTLYFSRELESIKARSYDIKREDLHARMVFPVSTESAPGTETITYRQYDMVGSAIIVSNDGTDVPRSDVSGKEFSSRVYSIASAYGWNAKDVRRSRLTGRSLESRRMMAARRALMEKENSLAFNGDAKTGIVGFFKNPNIPRLAIGTAWASATADQILADLNAIADVPSNLTNGIENASKMFMSIPLFNLINKKRFTDGSGQTVLSAFLQNNSAIGSVEKLQECKSAADDGGDLIFAYTPDPEKLQMELPMDMMSHPVREDGDFGWKVVMEEEHGGVNVYYPLSIVFAVGAG